MRPYVYGADLGGTRIKAGKKRVGEDFLTKVTIENLTDSEGPEVFNNLFRVIGSLNGGIKPEEAKIGLAMPGDFDHSRGLLNCRRFQLREFPYADFFAERKYQVIPINDAQASGMGELMFGAGKKFKDFIVVTLGTGIGGAIVLNGELLRSSEGRTVGIISHITVDPNGPVCRCGRRGCLEVYTDRKSILARASAQGLKIADVHEINGSADAGEKAREIFNDVGYHLAMGLAGVVDMFSPQAIILGGGISQVGDLILNPLRRHLLPLVREGRNLHIQISDLCDKAGVYGASYIAEMEKK